MRKPLIGKEAEAPVDLEEVMHLIGLISNKLKARKVIDRSLTYKDSERHIKGLIEEHTYQRVEQVTKWYVENMGKEFVPSIKNTKQFRAKFKQIVSRMETDPTLKVELSEDAKAIIKVHESAISYPTLQMLLPQIVQKSLDAYIPFWDKLNRIMQDWDGVPARRREHRILVHFHNIRIFDKPKNFVSAWVEWLADNPWLEGRELARFVWSPDNSVFSQAARFAAFHWTGQGADWDALLGCINKEK